MCVVSPTPDRAIRGRIVREPTVGAQVTAQTDMSGDNTGPVDGFWRAPAAGLGTVKLL
jgi:hypothetical protein